MKIYKVFYYLKINKRECLLEMEICAHTAREACVLCKDAVRLMDGRNAFRPSTRLSKDDLLELERLPAYVVQLKPETIAKIKTIQTLDKQVEK